MDEPGRVGRVERLGDLAQQRSVRCARRARARAISAASVGPGHELHREVQAVLGLAGLVDGDDVRVLERRLEPALAPEALDELGSSPSPPASTFRATRRSSSTWRAL